MGAGGRHDDLGPDGLIIASKLVVMMSANTIITLPLLLCPCRYLESNTVGGERVSVACLAFELRLQAARVEKGGQAHAHQFAPFLLTITAIIIIMLPNLACLKRFEAPVCDASSCFKLLAEVDGRSPSCSRPHHHAQQLHPPRDVVQD